MSLDEPIAGTWQSARGYSAWRPAAENAALKAVNARDIGGAQSVNKCLGGPGVMRVPAGWHAGDHNTGEFARGFVAAAREIMYQCAALLRGLRGGIG